MTQKNKRTKKDSLNIYHDETNSVNKRDFGNNIRSFFLSSCKASAGSENTDYTKMNTIYDRQRISGQEGCAGGCDCSCG